MQHRRQGATDRAGQCQRSQRVGRVVTATHAQRVGRHQPLQVDLFVLIFTSTTLECLVHLARPHQPGNAVLDHQAEITRPLRCIESETKDLATDRSGRSASPAFDEHRRGHHGFDLQVIAVDDHHAALAKDLGLGLNVSGHRAMPIQMVRAEIEHGRGVGLETLRAVELETRQFEHPDLRQVLEHRSGRHADRRLRIHGRKLIGHIAEWARQQRIETGVSDLARRLDRPGDRRIDRRFASCGQQASLFDLSGPHRLQGQHLGQRVEHRRPDVAGHRDPKTASTHQQSAHRGGRGLAVGTRDRQQLG